MLIISNVLGLLASLVMVYSGSINDKKRFIFVEIIMYVLFICSQFTAGAYTATIVNFLSLIRNLIYYKDKLNMKNKLVLIGLMIIFSLLINNNGIWGIIPLIGGSLFTYCIDMKDMIKFKWVLVICSFLWFIFDIHYEIYTSSFFDIGTVITSLWSIRFLVKNKGEKC